jgi:hypothetical protein
MMDTSFFLGRETLIPKLGSEMAFWRERLFVSMYRNATDAANYFMLPPNRVVELGSHALTDSRNPRLRHVPPQGPNPVVLEHHHADNVGAASSACRSTSSSHSSEFRQERPGA